MGPPRALPLVHIRCLGDYPFEVVLPQGLPIDGVVLADQVKHLDWKARRTEVVGKAPQAVVNEVLGKLLTLLS